jgi:nucleotide-binding universal stress UspA family protein
MKKIIAAIDGLKYSDNTVNYAIYLAKETNAAVIGVFLEDFSYHSYKMTDIMAGKELFEKSIKAVDRNDKRLRSEAVKKFKAACLKEKIEFVVHHDKSIAIQELLHESVYAELLVIDKRETLSSYDDKPPTRFIRDLLTDVKCPVLIVSGEVQPIKDIVFLYDGKPSAVHALKMFSYALPLKQRFSLRVFSVKENDQNVEPPESVLMKEYLKLHFPHARFTIKFGIAEVEVLRLLHKMKPTTLVVLGAYQRSRFSRWFKESMADVLMKDLPVPLFVAHNK